MAGASCLADGSITLLPGQTYRCRFSGEVTGPANSTHVNTVTATASDDDPTPAVVTAAARAEVAIVPVEVVPVLPSTDMLLAVEGPGLGERSFVELLRLVVLFLAATILVGGLGVAVVRRTRV